MSTIGKKWTWSEKIIDNLPKLTYPYPLGELTTKTEYVSSTPRKWTKQEEEWLLDKHKAGYSYAEIAEALNRTITSVSIKGKRLQKRTDNNTYNESHLDKKYQSNKKFYNDFIKGNTCLDLYCGVNSYWEKNTNMKVTTNDKDKNIKADYNEDAFKLACKLFYQGEKFDIVDLDPFGSAYESFELAIRMAKKGIIITFGEMGHKRWRRIDYVSKRYDIQDIEDFNIEKMIEKVQLLGIRHKKWLNPIIIDEFRNISRVYFVIEPYKETSQWSQL